MKDPLSLDSDSDHASSSRWSIWGVVAILAVIAAILAAITGPKPAPEPTSVDVPVEIQYTASEEASDPAKSTRSAHERSPDEL